MTAFDYAVLAIVGVSVLLSLMRGFLREVLALASWVAAFFVAKLYTVQLAPLLPEAIPTQSMRLLAAFVILFLGTLLIASLLSIALSGLFKKIGMGWLDRWLGALFGLARGVLIVTILVLLGGLTSSATGRTLAQCDVQRAAGSHGGELNAVVAARHCQARQIRLDY